MSYKSIDVYNILRSSSLNNKSSVLTVIPLLLGYYLRNIVFTKNIAKLTSDVLGFVNNITFGKLFIVILPYIIALILFYISNVLTASSIPKAELESLQIILDQLIESVKTSKDTINANELIIHLKKIADTKEIHKLLTSYVLPTIIVIIGILYYFFKCDTGTGIVVFLIIIIFVIVTINFEIYNINETYRAEKSFNDLFEEMHDILQNMDTVIALNTKEKEIKNISETKEDTFNKTLYSAITNINTSFSLEFFNLIATIIINYLAYGLYVDKKMSTSTFISVVILTIVFMNYYNELLHEIMEFVFLLGRLCDANKYLSGFKLVEPNGPNGNKKDLVISKGEIIFKDIVFKYGSNYVFNHFNLYIPAGKKIGLFGPIGSGKTTLLEMLINMKKYNGSIYIDNQDISQCTHESITNSIAYIPQRPGIFNKTILYNIRYGTNYDEKQIIEKLGDLELLNFINSFPKKMNTLVGKNGKYISEGQKQLVILIRVLLQNKPILLLDEPSCSLDRENKSILISIIKNIENKTVIISTHDNELSEIFDVNVNIDEKKSK